MATAVSIAIRKADAQGRIQQASIELAAKYGLGQAELVPTHKQPEIQTVLTLEAVASFLEALAAAEPVPVKKRKAQAAKAQAAD
jgi:hypothetical protein